MNTSNATNKVFDAIAWGVFAVVLGAGWLVSSYYLIDTAVYIALGVGVILIALNLARFGVGINISKFSLFVGIVAIALSGFGMAGIEIPLIPTAIVLVGLFIVAEAIQRTMQKKALQVQ